MKKQKRFKVETRDSILLRTVIIVRDSFSREELLKAIKEEFPNLRVVNVEEVEDD